VNQSYAISDQKNNVHNFQTGASEKATWSFLGWPGLQPRPAYFIFILHCCWQHTSNVTSLSNLTSISIILSTTATLWGSQEEMKAGIDFVKARMFAKMQNVDITSNNCLNILIFAIMSRR
jgi:hypothetical protein